MIAGIINWNDAEDLRPDLERMRGAPDPLAPKCWRTTHRAGWSLAVSAGEGPNVAGMASDPGGTLWGVLHGLFYNRAEILETLGKDTWVGKQSGDSELLLAAFQRWGEGLLDRFEGDFSFAIWDARTRELFAAIDPFGKRTFYHAEENGRFAFGTRLAPLEVLPWVGDAIDEYTVVAHLTDVWHDAEATFSKRISHIPAGHCLRANGKRTEVRRYWLPLGLRCEQKTTDDVLARFEELFRQAVRQRLPKERMAILMSGGLDSTSVAGLVGDIHRREPGAVPPTKIFSFVFGGLSCDESKYIHAALRRLPFPACQLSELERGPSLGQLFEDVQRDEAPALDEQSALQQRLLAELRAFGARVLLDGLGGDDLTTDYQLCKDMLQGGRLLQFFRAARYESMLRVQPTWRVLAMALYEASPGALKRVYRWVRGRPQRLDAVSPPDWLAPEARRFAAAMDPFREPSPQGFGSHSLETAWQMLNHPHVLWVNRWWVNHFASAGVRPCSPILDRRLFDFVFSVPLRLRPVFRDRASFKFFFTRGLRQYLPEELQARPDKVYFEPYNNFVFSLIAAPLRDYLLGGSEWLSEPFVPRARAAALFASFPRETDSTRIHPVDLARVIGPIWRMAGLEIWFRERQQRRGARHLAGEIIHGQDEEPLRQRSRASA